MIHRKQLNRWTVVVGALIVEQEAAPPRSRGGRRTRSGSSRPAGTRKRRRAGGRSAGRRIPSEALASEAGADPALTEALRSWRLVEARRRRIPAFRIFSNRVLLALALERPRDEGGLLSVKGVGPKLVESYGDALLEILRG